MNTNLWIEIAEVWAEKICGGNPDLNKNYNQGVYIADTLLSGQNYARNVSTSNPDSPDGHWRNLSQGIMSGEIKYAKISYPNLGILVGQVIVPEAKAET